MAIFIRTGLFPRRLSRRSAAFGRASGKGMFRALAWLAALLVFSYVCSLLIPIYIDNYQLQDAMREEAHYALVEHKNQEQIQEDVFLTAQNLGIPAPLYGIDVEPIEGGYRITVNYTVPLRIFLHRFDLRFHTSADSNSI
jgi:hypothetical protein